MTIHRSCARARAQRCGSLLAIVAAFTFSFPAHADPPLKAAPSALEEEAAPAPAPESTTFLSDSQRDSQRDSLPSVGAFLLRSPLFWMGVVSGVAGVSITLGAHIVELNAKSDMERMWPIVSRSGGGAPGTPFSSACATYSGAHATTLNARNLGEVVMVASGSMFCTSFLALAWGATLRAPAPIQVAPTVGGLVIRGAF